MNNKKIKFRIEGVALTALVIAAVILINVFFTVLGEKTDLKIDLTKEGVFNLAEETKNLVSSVNREIKIYYATNAQNRDSSYQEILESFSDESEWITVEEVNIDTNPSFANAYKLTDYNSIVVESKDKNGKPRTRIVRREHIEYKTSNKGRINKTVNNLEGYVAAAIRYVTSDEPLTVLVAHGHGEAVEDPGCLEYVMDMLYKEGMSVKTGDFSTEEITDDIDVVLLIGPSRDFTDFEIKKLDDYLEKGGRVQFYSNPGKSLLNINGYFEKNWGIKINDDCVSDKDTGYIASTPSSSYLMTVLHEHAMTDYFAKTGGKIRLTEGECNSLAITENDAIEANVLVTTSSTGISMSREDWVLKSNREKYAVDEQGQLNLLVYLRKNPLFNRDTTARLLVSGSCDIILDGFYDESSDYENKDLAIKSVNYMSGIEDAPVSVAGKNVIKEKMEPFTGKQLIFTMTGLVGIIPLIMFVLGIVVYVRRRRL